MSIAGARNDFLILPPWPDSTAEQLAAAAQRRGMAVERFWDSTVPEQLRGAEGGHLYGGPAFAAAVSVDLDLALLEPADAPAWPDT